MCGQGRERETMNVSWVSVTVLDEWASGGEESLAVKLTGGGGCYSGGNSFNFPVSSFSNCWVEWRWFACYQVSTSGYAAGYSVGYSVGYMATPYLWRKLCVDSTQKYKSGFTKQKQKKQLLSIIRDLKQHMQSSSFSQIALSTWNSIEMDRSARQRLA